MSMKPFATSTDSELNSTRIALKDSIRRKGWLTAMKPFYLQNLKKVEAEILNRDLVKVK
jgi:hypothetical protein